jgi:hypothetical protein
MDGFVAYLLLLEAEWGHTPRGAPELKAKLPPSALEKEIPSTRPSSSHKKYLREAPSLIFFIKIRIIQHCIADKKYILSLAFLCAIKSRREHG